MAEQTNSERRELLRKIQAADFFACDLHLYLNTHPNCMRALSLFKDATAQGRTLRDEYEKKYGPLTASASADTTPWQWSKDPWVWERS